MFSLQKIAIDEHNNQRDVTTDKFCGDPYYWLITTKNSSDDLSDSIKKATSILERQGNEILQGKADEGGGYEEFALFVISKDIAVGVKKLDHRNITFLPYFLSNDDYNMGISIYRICVKSDWALTDSLRRDISGFLSDFSLRNDILRFRCLLDNSLKVEKDFQDYLEYLN